MRFVDPSGLIVWPYTDTHRNRNAHNKCPKKAPTKGTCAGKLKDDKGNEWFPDYPTGAAEFHGGNNGFRRPDPDGSGGGFQCFYDWGSDYPIFIELLTPKELILCRRFSRHRTLTQCLNVSKPNTTSIGRPQKATLTSSRLVISDAHEGLKAAAKVLSTTWQRCRVHFLRCPRRLG